jgi:membrane peptidoglycan carboxypeptidase
MSTWVLKIAGLKPFQKNCNKRADLASDSLAKQMIGQKIRTISGSLTGVWDHFRLKEFQLGRSFSWRLPKSLRWIMLGATITALFSYELRTSALQSQILSSYAQRMSFQLGPGQSPSIVFPKHGPFDIRAGYALIPVFEQRLRAMGYRTTEQARFSPELERAANWGFLPPYSEPTSTKLTIRGMDGQSLFQAAVGGHSFGSFEEIPPLAVKSLLTIENRELSEPADSRTNPVVDWERLVKAGIFYAGHKLGLPLPVEGGSTLATQMEKYRHSDDGRTDSVLAKLRQMTDASLRVYQKGTDTREQRRQIVLDYLNSIPLSAAPGSGEIHGIGNGLNVWFGLNLQDVRRHLSSPEYTPEKAKAFKHLLALQCSVKAPSHYLLRNRPALESRVNYYVQLLANIQVIPQTFAEQVKSAKISFSANPQEYPVHAYAENKAINEIRSKLVSQLGLPGLYELDRLHLDVESTINPSLQHAAVSLFEKLHDPRFVDLAGLRGEKLLAKGDPSQVIYGMMLYEKTSLGNLLRVVTDNFDAPFNINTGMKMQLGSTAKLRTLTNYLDIVASLYGRLATLDSQALEKEIGEARDPITRWAAEALSQNKELNLDAFLQLALDRKYSAGAGEVFFTGGGAHAFHNFDKADNGRIVTIREATVRSVNLAYIRLMRDLVRYYEARLPYDTDAILSDIHNPVRRRMLQEFADEESKHVLSQAYKNFEKRLPEEIVATLLGNKAKSDRHLTMLFYAWNPGADGKSLAQWLEKHLGSVDPVRVNRLIKAYGNPQLNLSDYGYLLGIHPLTIWCAGQLAQDASLKWDQILSDGAEASRISSAWLFKTRNRSAQDLRLRIRFERDAFAHITIQWKRLGFPFDWLVPSYATAIGSSGDRPEALAQLMGILLNDGMQMPAIRMARLRFAGGTPYETAMEPAASKGTRMLHPAVARAILPVLAQVVKTGSAARLSGALKNEGEPLVVGGKTGSGDNRFDTVGRYGQRTSSRPVDRTAVFVFYIEDRFFGVITVLVPGEKAGDYGFTSSLPVAILKLLAPDIEALWSKPRAASSKDLALVTNSAYPNPGQSAPASISQ